MMFNKYNNTKIDKMIFIVTDKSNNLSFKVRKINNDKE